MVYCVDGMGSISLVGMLFWWRVRIYEKWRGRGLPTHHMPEHRRFHINWDHAKKR
jgi:hypothetical protein